MYEGWGSETQRKYLKQAEINGRIFFRISRNGTQIAERETLSFLRTLKRVAKAS